MNAGAWSGGFHPLSADGARAVGSPLHRDVVGGMKQYGCAAAMVITNSYFTEGAAALAEANECALVDRDTLAEWMEAARRGEG